MSSTPDEFRRAVKKAGAEAVSDEAGGLLVSDGEVRLHFALIGEAPQRIGALQLERLRVEITHRAGDAAAAAQLLERIDRATQRGGG